MANTYTALHYHVVYSTKNRVPYLTQDIEQRVWAYIGGVARRHNMTALQIGGFDDHIHALVTTPPDVGPQPDRTILERRFVQVDPRDLPDTTSVRLAARLQRVHCQQIGAGHGGEVYSEATRTSSAKEFPGRVPGLFAKARR